MGIGRAHAAAICTTNRVWSSQDVGRPGVITTTHYLANKISTTLSLCLVSFFLSFHTFYSITLYKNPTHPHFQTSFFYPCLISASTFTSKNKKWVVVVVVFKHFFASSWWCSFLISSLCQMHTVSKLGVKMAGP